VVPDAKGRPAFAVLPWDEYEALRTAAAEAAEDAADAARAAAIAGRIETGAEVVFPAAVLDRLDAGDNPIRVFRDYCGMTQQALAAAAGVNQGYLSELESGAKTASVKTLRALARALSVDIDLLLPPEDLQTSAA
jgi:DNA-binding XRE family transcriptional regulator